MKLIVVAGFLGSGKTTLILELARRLVTASHQVAIIENEIGDIGIDGARIADQGLLVKELFGGCVCCTLQVGLVDTLQELDRTFAPDYVILEPTGIARPSDLTATVRQYAGSVDGVRVVTLLDAERYEMLTEVIGPLLEGQVADADVIAVTKVDAVEREVVDAVIADVRAGDTSTPLLRVSAERGTNVDALMAELT